MNVANIDTPPPSAPIPNGPNLNNNANGQFKFPTDQQLGITPGTIVSDPNFNVGKHPGEIYVDNGRSTRRRDPAALNGNSKNWSSFQQTVVFNKQKMVSKLSYLFKCKSFIRLYRTFSYEFSFVETKSRILFDGGGPSMEKFE